MFMNVAPRRVERTTGQSPCPPSECNDTGRTVRQKVSSGSTRRQRLLWCRRGVAISAGAAAGDRSLHCPARLCSAWKSLPGRSCIACPRCLLSTIRSVRLHCESRLSGAVANRKSRPEAAGAIGGCREVRRRGDVERCGWQESEAHCFGNQPPARPGDRRPNSGVTILGAPQPAVRFRAADQGRFVD